MEYVMTVPPEATRERGIFIVGGKVKATLSDQDRHIVEDHLASFLQVHNLVILIGSGASFHLGSPETRNLKNLAVIDLIGTAGEEVDASDRKLLSLLNPDDNGDLEKLLNGLQLAASLAEQAALPSVTFGEGDSAQSFTPAQIDQLKGKINVAFAKACELPQSNIHISDPLATHRQFFSRIVRSRRSNLPRTKIFTTNYDLVIERALDELGYPYIDGFSGTVDRRLNLAYYGLDFHRVETASQQVVARADSALYLHKIHGSLNWKAEVDSSAGITTLEVVQVAEGSASIDDPVLIYPTTAKEGDSLSYPYSDLMRLLSDAVQQNDTAILTIGYGYSDPHINRILLRSLAINPALNVLAIDPFAVLENNAAFADALLDDELVGQTLTARKHTVQDTPVGALATADDSRIAVLTGPVGKFENVVDLLPESSLDMNMTPPAAIMSLIESLEQFTSSESTGEDAADE